MDEAPSPSSPFFARRAARTTAGREAATAFAAREDVEATRLAIEEQQLKRLVLHPELEAA
ncbi:hypothetical protein [Streptomyces sp. AcE210]|uniref:hypothetical protein n=1 Tax=Streptomyces sp. AcE210 TaxID=2292703 RepID=UPI001058FAF9|nr:hypothetical protein [Streptomyces sp. AcE210]